MIANVTRAEWRWALIASLSILLLTSLPYLAGQAAQTPEWVFGGALIDRMDYNVHLASIHSGLRGQWRYPLLHTSEDVPPAYVKPFYIAVGQIGRLLPLTPPALYQAARLACGLWALLAMYAFAAHFITTAALRRAAFMFFALGSGFGWLMLAARWQPQAGVSPIDFWLVDLYGFFSLLVFPHFAAVMALLWIMALGMLRHWRTGQWRWLAAAAAAAVLAQAIQPFAPLVVDLSLAAYALLRLSQWRTTSVSVLLLAAAQIPLLWYWQTIFASNAVWRSFSLQNYTPSPPPLYYLLGLGIPGALALWGGWHAAKRKTNGARFAAIWFGVAAVLVVQPTQFQRRFAEGVMGPVAVMAALGLQYGFIPALRRLKWPALAAKRTGYPYRRLRGTLLALTIAMAAPSSLYLAAGSVWVAIARSPELFDPANVVQGIDWLGTNSDWPDTVFSAERTGNFIPARIGHRVYLGHPIETADYAAKAENVQRFFDGGMSGAERQALLAACRCRFVFYGPYERAIGNYDVASADFLKLRFANEAVQIFEVRGWGR